MTKSDLIEALAAKESLTAKQATEIIKLILKGFTDTLKKGDRIELRGFGSFTMREYKAYGGRNPRTGKNVDVRPKKLPFFKAAKGMKGLVDAEK
jgi:integration host factor subunit beta